MNVAASKEIEPGVTGGGRVERLPGVDAGASRDRAWLAGLQPSSAVYLAPIAVFFLVSIKLPSIDSRSGILSILVLSSILGIAAVGQSLAIVIGGIDLSIPATIGLANVLVATLTQSGWNFGLICLLLLGLSLAVGMVNGSLSSIFNLHPLVVTLGVGSIITGGILEQTGGQTGGSVPQGLINAVSPIGKTFFLPIPICLALWIIVSVAVVAIERRTVIGRRVFTLGANPRAARLALVNPVAVRIFVYSASAACACLAGVLLAGFSSGASVDIGQPYLFSTITAVVVGGTALIGGRGGYARTIAGAVLTVEIQTLLVGLGAGASMQEVLLGVIILVLVGVYGRESPVSSRI